MPSFQLAGIDHQPFEPLFERSDAGLRELGAIRRVATESPGFPCRVSLEDAAPGEELLLLPFVHQPADSPYRASGPIFVRRGAARRVLEAGEVPPYITRRLISVRVYDSAHMMISATVCEGPLVAAELERQFDDRRVAYAQLHNAKPGCFACTVERA
ncbi:MAG: DUF1203 domain-containing protein [Rhizobiales bacterium]|nr:DUF1203 domain-containing protein [Rhizobacter sp.]